MSFLKIILNGLKSCKRQIGEGLVINKNCGFKDRNSPLQCAIHCEGEYIWARKAYKQRRLRPLIPNS